MKTDQIEDEIRNVLDSFGDDFWNESWGDRTRRVKNRIGAIGKAEGYSVYANQSDFGENGEWLFDMTWLVIEDGFVVNVPLVLESEWKRGDEIGNDFQKLMVSRAELRVMIFSFPDEESATTEINDLQKAVGLFSAGQASDRYLLATYREDLGRFDYCSFCAGELVTQPN